MLTISKSIQTLALTQINFSVTQLLIQMVCYNVFLHLSATAASTLLEGHPRDLGTFVHPSSDTLALILTEEAWLSSLTW